MIRDCADRDKDVLLFPARSNRRRNEVLNGDFNGTLAKQMTVFRMAIVWRRGNGHSLEVESSVPPARLGGWRP